MSVTQLKNYAEGKWVAAKQEGDVLFNAITGDAIYTLLGSKKTTNIFLRELICGEVSVHTL